MCMTLFLWGFWKFSRRRLNGMIRESALCSPFPQRQLVQNVGTDKSSGARYTWSARNKKLTKGYTHLIKFINQAWNMKIYCGAAPFANTWGKQLWWVEKMLSICPYLRHRLANISKVCVRFPQNRCYSQNNKRWVSNWLLSNKLDIHYTEKWQVYFCSWQNCLKGKTFILPSDGQHWLKKLKRKIHFLKCISFHPLPSTISDII